MVAKTPAEMAKAKAALESGGAGRAYDDMRQEDRQAEAARLERLAATALRGGLHSYKWPENPNKKADTKVKDQVDLSKLPDHSRRTMNDIIQDLLKEADIPQQLWAKVASDLTKVLRVAKDSDGKASAVRRPSHMPKRMSDLSPEAQEKERQRNARKKANQRANRKARETAKPALG